ncbi:MAG TPA: hotdog domain-containing protein [Acidimicrobiales bacterium]
MPAKVGLSASIEFVVAEADTAIAMRSGAVPVLATPVIIARCEEAAIAAIAGHLAPNETTVGAKVRVDHLAPTAVGHRVRAEATVEKVAGRRITFTVSGHDERGLVVVGRLTRVVVDVGRFMEKAN